MPEDDALGLVQILVSRDTWLLLIPDMPIALTRSSTERVEIP